MKIKGVDISYCQSGIDYSALKNSGVKFAIIRAGIGTRTDSLLDTHVKGCVANGIAYGFYWYSVASSVQEAKAEAAACLKAIAKHDRPAYPVFFDMEEQSQIDKLDSKTRTDMALAFCEEIERGGYPAGVYANPSWLECYYEKDRIAGIYDIWLAHWTNSPDRPSEYDYGQTMWQWGIDNIGMDIDGDIAFIDYTAKTAYWYGTHTQLTTEQQPAAEQSEPTQPTAELGKGDEVTLKNAPLYGASTSKSKATTVSGTYWVHSDGIINGRIRITTPEGCADCTGWVNVADCKAANQTAPKNEPSVKIGDIVKVKSGAKTYDGGALAAFVYTQKYEVMELKGDRAVIGQNGQVTAAVNKADLIAV